jgi:hypothetical protein
MYCRRAAENIFVEAAKGIGGGILLSHHRRRGDDDFTMREFFL